MEKENFEYNENLDSLYLYSGLNEDVFGVINVGNFVFDVGVSGKLVGLEIENASKFFEMGLTMLSSIMEPKLFVRKQGNSILLGFGFKINNKSFNYNYMIPKNKLALTC